MKIIDLHTHILPGIDDGADSMETALQMLKNAEASHVVALAATPHCNIPGWVDNHYDDKLLQHLRNLRIAALNAGIDIKILSGMEVRANENLLPLLQAGKLLPLNGGRYLLTEFAPDVTLSYCLEILQTIRDQGMIPLVAHPERYGTIWQNPDAVNDWLDMGCHIQITGGSVLGKFGRDAYHTADYLLRHNMAACIASDAHGLQYRTNQLSNVYDHVSLHINPVYAHMVLFDNPFRICQNETL